MGTALILGVVHADQKPGANWLLMSVSPVPETAPTPGLLVTIGATDPVSVVVVPMAAAAKAVALATSTTSVTTTAVSAPGGRDLVALPQLYAAVGYSSGTEPVTAV
jgi:hypothetical protein